MNANTPQCSCSCNEDAGPPALSVTNTVDIPSLCGIVPGAIVYSCAGAADTGEIADRAARQLDVEDKAWMSCLAGIGGRVSGLLVSAAAAPALLAIDGCPQDCAKKTLELAGFTNVKHVRVTDLGFKKGKTPPTEETVGKVADAAAALLKN